MRSEGRGLLSLRRDRILRLVRSRIFVRRNWRFWKLLTAAAATENLFLGKPCRFDVGVVRAIARYRYFLRCLCSYLYVHRCLVPVRCPLHTKVHTLGTYSVPGMYSTYLLGTTNCWAPARRFLITLLEAQNYATQKWSIITLATSRQSVHRIHVAR